MERIKKRTTCICIRIQQSESLWSHRWLHELFGEVSHQVATMEETVLRDTNFLTNDENAVETSLAHAKGEAIIRKNLSPIPLFFVPICSVWHDKRVGRGTNKCHTIFMLVIIKTGPPQKPPS